MKNRFVNLIRSVVPLILIVLLILVFIYAFHNLISPEHTAKSISSVKKVSTQPLIIDIPKASNTGSVTVKDVDGNIYFHYTGEIDIQNDGKNGENIEIAVVVPSEDD